MRFASLFRRLKANSKKTSVQILHDQHEFRIGDSRCEIHTQV